MFLVSSSIVRSIILAIVIIANVGCSNKEKEKIVEEEMRIITMTDQAQKKFEGKFFKLKYDMSISEVKQVLLVRPSEQSDVYKPAFFSRDSKKVATTLYYKIKDKMYFLNFSPLGKLNGKSISNSNDIVIWDEWQRNQNKVKALKP